MRTAGRRRGVENGVVKALCHVDWDRAVNKRYYPGRLENDCLHRWVGRNVWTESWGASSGFLSDADDRPPKEALESLRDFYGGYERCVGMLNRTAKMCLR